MEHQLQSIQLSTKWKAALTRFRINWLLGGQATKGPSASVIRACVPKTAVVAERQISLAAQATATGGRRASGANLVTSGCQSFRLPAGDRDGRPQWTWSAPLFLTVAAAGLGLTVGYTEIGGCGKGHLGVFAWRGSAAACRAAPRRPPRPPACAGGCLLTPIPRLCLIWAEPSIACAARARRPGLPLPRCPSDCAPASSLPDPCPITARNTSM